MRASFVTGLVTAGVVAACTPGVNTMKDNLSACTTIAVCDANDGKQVAVVGTYRLFPDQPGVDYTGVPRAARIALDDGLGPFLEPYWHKQAARSDAEIARFVGKKVRVIGRYYREQPRNPDDPPHASSMGGPCLHPVERIELVE
jgi:hypothetical protein